MLFRSDTMRIINILPTLNGKDSFKIFKDDILREHVLINDIRTLEVLFTKAMKRSQLIFNDHTFRKSYPGIRRTPINKALFEVWSTLMAKLNDDEFESLLSNKEDFLHEYSHLLVDSSFNYAISRDSLKFQSVKDRYEKLSGLLKKYI